MQKMTSQMTNMQKRGKKKRNPFAGLGGMGGGGFRFPF